MRLELETSVASWLTYMFTRSHMITVRRRSCCHPHTLTKSRSRREAPKLSRWIFLESTTIGMQCAHNMIFISKAGAQLER